MAFCPECKEEFVTEITMCPECEVELVDSLNEEGEVGDLEVACTVLQEENAYIVRGFLESEGIPCQLENVTSHAFPAGELTKVRLWTRKEDAEKARQLIKDHEQFPICSSCGHVVGPEDTVCDFCGESFK